jgi:hypothetical protein
MVDEMTQIAAETGWRNSARRPRSSSLEPASLAPPPSPRPRADRRPETQPEIIDQESLEVWLQGVSPEVAAAIAARTALRVAPLLSRDARKARSAKDVSAFLGLTSAVFRASALARVAGKYPARAYESNAAALVAAARAAAAPAAAAARDFADWAIGIAAPALAAAADAADAAVPALAAAADAAALGAPFAFPLAAPSGASFLAVYATADGAIRAETHFDATAQQRLGARGLADLPLWSRDPADWVEGAWEALKLALSRDEGWDVWIDWYDDRLRGGSRGEDYELVFVKAPLYVWDKGPAAANAWIKEHLPKDSGGSSPLQTPKPLSGPA